jgi:hypothetical protein
MGGLWDKDRENFRIFALEIQACLYTRESIVMDSTGCCNQDHRFKSLLCQSLHFTDMHSVPAQVLHLGKVLSPL